MAVRTTKSSAVTRTQKQLKRTYAAVAEEHDVVVRLVNKPLYNAFGDPFYLQNFRFDPEIVGMIQAELDGTKAEPNDEVYLEELNETISLRDDVRLRRNVHSDMAYAVEFFLRSRDAQSGKSIVVKTQTDSDHVWDIGQALQHFRIKDYLELSKGDHRWLVDKVKECAFQVYPTDARMFLDALAIAYPPQALIEVELGPDAE